jgi:hypothetical protein
MALPVMTQDRKLGIVAEAQSGRLVQRDGNGAAELLALVEPLNAVELKNVEKSNHLKQRHKRRSSLAAFLLSGQNFHSAPKFMP